MRVTWQLVPALLSFLVGCQPTDSGSGSSGSAVADDSKGSVTVIGGAAEPTYSFCSTTWSKTDFLKMMNGNLVFVADANSHGKDAAAAIGDLVTMIVVNGLDFATLAEYDLSFSDGDYTYGSEGGGYTFSLYFAEDFGEFNAGDKIPYNVFDYESYVTDINVDVTPSLVVTYDEGPLFNLIDGSIETDGSTIAAPKFQFNIHSELVSFAMNSRTTYNGSSPREADTLLWNMTTTAATLPTIQAQFASGGYGLLFDDSIYTSEYFGLVQTFGSSPALIKHDDTGYFWELNYEATVAKSAAEVYLTGVASERVQNSTTYYCDADHEHRIGVATHATDLASGSFEFEDGTTISYGLEDF